MAVPLVDVSRLRHLRLHVRIPLTFTAASYVDDATGLSFNAYLVTAQVLGYALSKCIGIRVIAEMRPERRAGVLLALIGLAEMALLLFAVLPRPWNATGYVGYVAVMLGRRFWQVDVGFLAFFNAVALGTVGISLIALVGAAVFFRRSSSSTRQPTPLQPVRA